MSELYSDLNLTVFPQNVDQFLTFLNITATDGPLIAQYQTALQNGNITLANQILAQIPSGTQKIIKATDLNKLTQAILAVERFYKTDIEPYVEDKQTEWLSVINQFSYKGTWSTGTFYQVNNLVTYTTSGLTLVYLATSTPPVGAVPTNTQYWRLLTIQGQQGASGEGLSYRQEWNVSTQYQINDAVTYDGTIWMSLQSNTGVQPGTNNAVWQQIIFLETAAYPIQPTEPQGLAQGDLWFNTQGNPTKYIYEVDVTNFLDNVNGEVIGATLEEKEVALQETKADLKAALAEKGQTVGEVFSAYPAAVRAIETGGELVTGTITVGRYSGITQYSDGEGFKLLSGPGTIKVLKNTVVIPFSDGGNTISGGISRVDYSFGALLATGDFTIVYR